jgi:hypothetical protein
MCPRKRRDLLALAGATATSLAAGCLSTGEGEPATATTDDGPTTTDDDQATTTDASADTTDGADDATATVDGEFAPRTWLPAPGSELDPYFGFAGDLGALRDADVGESALGRTTGTTLALPGDVLAGEEVVEFATVQPLGTACTFTPETAEVRSRLAAADPPATPTATPAAGTSTGEDDDAPETSTAGETASRVDAPDGYEGYETRTGVYWLGADHLLYGPSREFLHAVQDAHAGDRDRYAANATVGPVLAAAGDADLLAVAARSHQIVSSASGFAYAWRFGDRAELVAPFAFPDADATDADAVAALGEYAGFAEYEAKDVTADGRVATFTGELPVSEFDLLERDDGGRRPNGGSDSVPQVSFAFEATKGSDGEWDGDDDERVVVTHQGGDSVDLANVALHYEGSDVAKSDVFASTKPAGDTWAAGGQWTLRVDAAGADFESGATLQVVWTSEDGSQSAVIGMFQLP